MLLIRIQNRDQQALEELYGLFSVRLKHYVMRYVRNGQSAEDVTHDIFLRIWRYAASFDPTKTSKPESWIFQIARNQALTEAVLIAKTVSIDFNAEDCEIGIDWMQQEQDNVNMTDQAAAKSAAFNRAIVLLPPNYRQAIYLRYNRELTHQQIADTLGVPVGTVKTWLRRAVLQMRKQLHVRIVNTNLEVTEA
jgi:RNA polymerase sigma-70 factor (ECF subfamily)